MRRRRIFTTISSFLVAAVAILTLIFLIDASKVHAKFFLDCKERWGIDVGSREVAPTTIGTNISYKFEYKGYRRTEKGWGRKLQSVVCIDADGRERCFPNIARTMEDSSRKEYSRRSYKYDDQDRINLIGEFSPKGVLRNLIRYEKGRKDRVEISNFDEFGNPLTGENSRVFATFNDSGVQAKLEMLFPNGSRQIVSFDAEERPHMVEIRALNNELCIGGDGVAITKRYYDHNGWEVGREFFDKDCKRCYMVGNVAGWTNEYDTVFHWCRRTNLDVHNRPQKNSSGVVSVEWCFNDEHCVTERLLYGENNKLIGGSVYEYDDQGRLKLEMRLNEKKRLSGTEQGVAIVKYEYDESSHIERRRFYDANTNACNSTEGAAGISFGTDDAGNQICVASLGLDGLCRNNEFGYAIIRRKFDAKHRITDQWCEDEKGNAVAPATNGTYVALHDEGGVLRTHTEYVGSASFVNEIEVAAPRSWRYIRFYNVAGVTYKVEYLNDNKSLVDGPHGWAYYTTKVNDYNEVTECAYYNLKRTLTADSETKVAILRCEYDHDTAGVSVAVHFLNEERFHVFNNGIGCAVMKVRYDSSYRLVSALRLDANGKPLKFGSSEVERFELEYDSENRISCIRPQKFDGSPCMVANGKCLVDIKFEYAEKGGLKKIIGCNDKGEVLKEITELGGDTEAFIETFKAMTRILRYRRNFMDVTKQDQQDFQLYGKGRVVP